MVTTRLRLFPFLIESSKLVRSVRAGAGILGAGAGGGGAGAGKGEEATDMEDDD